MMAYMMAYLTGPGYDVKLHPVTKTQFRQGSLPRVYGLLISRVSLKINGGMWLIVYDQQPIYTLD